MKRNRAIRRGLTLIELLIVVAISLAISCLVAYVYVSSTRQMQMTLAEQQLMQAIRAAQDRAKQTGQPAGIRLLPDPAFPIQYPQPANGAAVRRWAGGPQTKAATR